MCFLDFFSPSDSYFVLLAGLLFTAFIKKKKSAMSEANNGHQTFTEGDIPFPACSLRHA